MADNSNGGNGGLYFIVGGLVAVVAVGVFLYLGGYLGHGGKTTTEQTTISAPASTSSTTTSTTTEKSRP